MAQTPSLLLLAFQAPGVPPDEGPGLLHFFLEAGAMAKLVLAVLVGFSLGSWAIMIWKHLQLKKAEAQSRRFVETFRRSSRFSEVNSAAPGLSASPLVGIFQAGYAEIDAQIKAARASERPSAGAPAAHGGLPQDRGEEPSVRSYRIRSLPAVERTLRRAVGVEIQQLARGTPFLATTAASTPFIGLFGTVWGIMVAFQEIGVTGSTSIVTVAPGIAEALVNTAAGLAAAIPALIGYNHFAARLRRLRSRMEDFVLELVNLSERNFT